MLKGYYSKQDNNAEWKHWDILIDIRSNSVIRNNSEPPNLFANSVNFGKMITVSDNK
jgi:hypothetical protein